MHLRSIGATSFYSRFEIRDSTNIVVPILRVFQYVLLRPSARTCLQSYAFNLQRNGWIQSASTRLSEQFSVKSSNLESSIQW